MTEQSRLADYLQPTLPESRLARQWANINEREPIQVRAVFRYAYLAAAFFAVLAIGFVAGRQLGGAEATDGSFVVEHGPADGQRLVLPEGIVVEVAKGSALRVHTRSRHETVLRLERGSALFDVTHRDGRRVVVATPGFDVEVVGTRFRVQVADQGKTTSANQVPEVTVEVLRGTVRVQSADSKQAKNEVSHITTGHNWSSVSRLVKAVTAVEPAGSVPPVVVAPDLPQVSSASQSPEHTPAPASAKELFELAERHRVAGRLSAAAIALDSLRRTYPGDSRAALAAFELGRIRMDGLGDLSGAVSAFNAAIQLNSSGAYREDAEARLVQLHERMGQLQTCRQAKSSYLARYAQGRHVSAVRSACGK